MIMRVCGGTTEESIAYIAESYFQHLFTSANLVNANVVLDSADKLVTPRMNDILLQRYTSEELRVTSISIPFSIVCRRLIYLFENS